MQPLRRSLLVATLLAAGVVTPVPATVSVVPELAGATTVVGSTPKVMKVRMPVDGTLSAGNITVTGNGRFAGVVLRRIGAPADVGPVVFMIRYNMCFSGPACAPRNPRDFFYAEGPASEPSFAGAHLPAGDYQLYLFADQAPVAVTFAVAGLVGSTTYAPAKAVPVSVASPHPSLPRTDPATAYFSASVTRTFGGAGAGTLTALGFDAPIPGHVETIYGTCAFRGRPLPRSIMGPGCPHMGSLGPSGNLLEDGTITADRYDGYAYGAFNAAPGPWTVGSYFINAGPTANAAAFFVLFDFNDAYTP